MFSNTLDLLYNLALLVALSVISGFIRERREHQAWGGTLQGVLFGIAAVIGMMRPLVLGPGLIFDGRSVMLSLCGLFFGPLAVMIAGGMALIYRIIVGGVGIYTGMLVIIASALIGLVFHSLWIRRGEQLTAGRFLNLGLVVHGAMLLLMFTLPAGAGTGVVKRLGLPILLAYPLVTLLIGKVLSGQETALRALGALRVSERRLAHAVSATSDAIWEWNYQTGETHYSPRWYEMLGYGDQALPMTFEVFKELCHPEDFHRVMKCIDDSLATPGAEGYKTEFRMRTRTDEWCWILGRGNVVEWDRSGRPLLLCGTHTDITDRKVVGEKLLESETKYRTLVENLLSGMVVHNPDTSIQFSNAMASSLLGLTEEQMLGKTAMDPRWRFLREDGSAMPFEEYPVNRVIASGNGYAGLIVGVCRPDYPEPVWMVSSGYPVQDGKGQIAQVVITFTDITEWKRAEHALKMTRFSVDSASDSMFWITPDARIVDVNQAACRSLGYTREAMLELTVPDVDTRFDTRKWPQHFAELRTLGSLTFESEQRHRDGRLIPVEIVANYVKFGEEERNCAFVRDIADRRRREDELKQKTAEMERFTYMISHDLKSPLVTVRTFLGYLEQDLAEGKADRVAKDMGFIRDAVVKMGRLLEDLLEVSRVGRVVNPPVRVSLADLIQEALAAVAGAISMGGVVVHVEVPTIILFGDRPRLEELWQNLVENAVKYMGDQPSPRIELGVEGLGADVVFFARDNGMGIDPRFQAKVFDLFEKLDASSEGTGLGLALVKRIVEVYEGRIWLESEGSGQGTCFRFTLPLALKEPKQGARS